MDMETMCRTCSSQLKAPRNIFETKNLLERILKFTDIQIQRDDGLPSNICEICNLKLEIADKFRREVGEADVRIRQMLRQTTFARDSRVRVTSRRSTSTFRTVRPIRDSYERRLNRGDQQKITRSVPTRVSRVSRSSFHSKSWTSEMKTDRREEIEEEIAPTMRDFAYSHANGRTLSNCYRLLIDCCLDYGVHENFMLPSSLVYNDVSPGSIRVTETEVRPRVPCADGDPTGTAAPWIDEELQMRYLKTDPLNLLRIKTIRPLAGSVDGRSTEDGRSCTFASTTNTGASISPDAIRKRLRSSSNHEEKSSETVDGRDNAFFATTRPTRRCASSMSHDVGRRSRAISLILGTNSGSAKKTPSRRTRGKNELSCVCPVCYRVCASSVGVQIHFKAHRSSRCPICQKPTRSKGTFRRHMKRHLLLSQQNEKFIR